MSLLWDNMKKAAAKASAAAMVAGNKTRLHGEILLVDREIRGRKQQFGIDLYNHVGPLANSPDFFAADDPLTATLRPPLLTAQREIAALEIRRTKVKEDIKQAEVKRAAAFPDKAISFADKAKNAAKSAALAGNEAKLATDLSVVESQIKHFKQQFGEDIYGIFVDLEDNKGWLPTDRTIRSMYDKARQDIEKLTKKRSDKISELEALGGTYNAEKKKEPGSESYDAPAVPTPPVTGSNLPQQSSSQTDMFGSSNTMSSTAPVASSGMFATTTNQPMASSTSGISSSTNYQPSSAPIAQTGSYLQSDMHVSQAPGGYSDAPSMGGGYSDQAAMGGAMGSGGYSDQVGDFDAFAGLSGSGGGSSFTQQPQQQQLPPPVNGMFTFPQHQMSQPNYGAASSGGYSQQQQQQQPNNAFGNFSDTPNNSRNNQQGSSSGQSNDLLLF